MKKLFSNIIESMDSSIYKKKGRRLVLKKWNTSERITRIAAHVTSEHHNITCHMFLSLFIFHWPQYNECCHISIFYLAAYLSQLPYFYYQISSAEHIYKLKQNLTIR